jgi:hypothetical protein
MPKPISGAGDPSAVTMDWKTARGVAEWMYEAAERDNVPAWHGIGRIGRLGDRWRVSLAAG